MRFTMLPLLAAMLSTAACSGAPDETATGDTANPAASTGTSTLAYRCEDGTMLRAEYGDADVRVHWADGRTATLPRAESASAGGGDAYVGSDVSLQRTGSGFELHDGENATVACNEVPKGDASAQAAAPDNTGITMRYACDADTSVTVMANGSAEVHLPDGRAVTVSRIAGSAPPVFTGESLYFTVGENGARLSQDEAANVLRCNPA